MKVHWLRLMITVTAVVAVLPLLAGCDDEEAIKNKNPGLNDLNVVVAFGDSLTSGSECACVPYPARLAGMINKVVVNEGNSGSRANEGLSRIQGVINSHRPAFMLILYGVNDIIHGGSPDGTAAAVMQMADICRQNNVVPVLATYPRPFAGHNLFSTGTIRLNRAIREMCRAQNIHYVNLEREFSAGRDPAIPEWPVTDPLLMEPDGLHPNDAGTQVIAAAFADLF